MGEVEEMHNEKQMTSKILTTPAKKSKEAESTDLQKVCTQHNIKYKYWSTMLKADTVKNVKNYSRGI